MAGVVFAAVDPQQVRPRRRSTAAGCSTRPSSARSGSAAFTLRAARVLAPRLPHPGDPPRHHAHLLVHVARPGKPMRQIELVLRAVGEHGQEDGRFGRAGRERGARRQVHDDTTQKLEDPIVESRRQRGGGRGGEGGGGGRRAVGGAGSGRGRRRSEWWRITGPPGRQRADPRGGSG